MMAKRRDATSLQAEEVLHLPSVTTWPPPDDLPISVTAGGVVLSRAGDPFYNMTPYGFRQRIYFTGAKLTADNSILLRRIAQWLLWKRNATITIRTVSSYLSIIRPIFYIASHHGIVASNMHRFPRLVAEIPGALMTSCADQAFALMHEIWEAREEVGFFILDKTSLRQMSRALPDHETKQYPYCPPRIWLYQLGRLHACLSAFMENVAKLESLFEYCLDAYEAFLGAKIHFGAKRDGRGPFGKGWSGNAAPLGRFMDACERFTVKELIVQWIHAEEVDIDCLGVRAFTKYFDLIICAGTALIVNLTGMRISEAFSLRCDCVQRVPDPGLGTVTLIKGTTKKGFSDDGALWVTSPTAVLAVSAMSSVARMRVKAAARTGVPIDEIDATSPYLHIGSYEPWARHPKALIEGEPMYNHRIPRFSQLDLIMDPDELRIRREDLDVALLITPSLPADAFDVGLIWPLTYHSLRRTSAVNMAASGLVSIQTLQYQLKHATVAQALYYGRGSSGLALSRRAVHQYIRTVYELANLQLGQLTSHRYVSPVSETAKAALLAGIQVFEPADIKRISKVGVIPIRETLLGACLQPEPCEYGGVETIVRCTKCKSALADREKLPLLLRLKDEVTQLLLDNASDTPYRRALQAQLTQIESVLRRLT